MNRLFYKGLWNKGQCILNFNVYLGVVSQPKTSGTVKSFNFNMSDLSSWDSNVTFPFLLQCAPGVIPYFGPERLERVDRMIIKVPPTHLIIWQYLVGEVGDEGFKEKLKQVETQLNENSKNWVLPSKVGIEKYWTLLKNDKSLPHKLLNLSNLIALETRFRNSCNYAVRIRRAAYLSSAIRLFKISLCGLNSSCYLSFFRDSSPRSKIDGERMKWEKMKWWWRDFREDERVWGGGIAPTIKARVLHFRKIKKGETQGTLNFEKIKNCSKEKKS